MGTCSAARRCCSARWPATFVAAAAAAGRGGDGVRQRRADFGARLRADGRGVRPRRLHRDRRRLLRRRRRLHRRELAARPLRRAPPQALRRSATDAGRGRRARDRRRRAARRHSGVDRHRRLADRRRRDQPRHRRRGVPLQHAGGAVERRRHAPGRPLRASTCSRCGAASPWSAASPRGSASPCSADFSAGGDRRGDGGRRRRHPGDAGGYDDPGSVRGGARLRRPDHRRRLPRRVHPREGLGDLVMPWGCTRCAGAARDQIPGRLRANGADPLAGRLSPSSDREAGATSAAVCG